MAAFGGWTTTRNLYGTIAASGITSEVLWVGDARALSLQFLGSPSTTTVQASNSEGRQAEIGATEWSTVTVLGPGIYVMETGPRWLRMQRSETTTAYVAQQQPW